MQREDLVVATGGEEGVFRLRELQPHHQRFDAAKQQEDKCRQNVTPADFLMID